MKYLFAAVLMASSVATVGAANAAGGCGGGFHRDYYGRCVPNAAVVVAPAPVYVAPRPVYVAPRPVYVAPRPVVVAPRPVVVRPARPCAYGRCRVY